MALFTPDGLTADAALRFDEQADLPDEGLVLVPATRWLGARPEELARIKGLIVRPDDPLDGLPPHLERVELQVDGFADGRVFSQARLLRKRYGFGGTISVAGPILPDQAGYLFRCGVDAIVVPDDVDPDPWSRASGRFRRHYQTAARGLGARVERGTGAARRS